MNLDQFLKENQPMPPSPSPYEAQRIWARIKTKKRWEFFWSALIPCTATIFLALFMIALHSHNTAPRSQEELAQFLEQTMGDTDEGGENSMDESQEEGFALADIDTEK